MTVLIVKVWVDGADMEFEEVMSMEVWDTYDGSTEGVPVETPVRDPLGVVDSCYRAESLIPQVPCVSQVLFRSMKMEKKTLRRLGWQHLAMWLWK